MAARVASSTSVGWTVPARKASTSEQASPSQGSPVTPATLPRDRRTAAHPAVRATVARAGVAGV